MSSSPYVSREVMAMFKVGEFARIGRVSVKILRHYDDLGLLRPARVDPASGYRYYTADQLPRLHRIVALKDLGFSLAQIGRLLKDDLPPEQLRGMLELRQAEIEQRVRVEQARLVGVEARLRQIEQADGVLYDVARRRLAPRTVAAIRATISDPDLVGRLFDEVEVFAARHDARSPDPPLLLHHDSGRQTSSLDLEVAVPLTRSLAGDGRVSVGELAAVTEAACVLHPGSYAALGRAADALSAWTAAHDYRPAGPLRAVYVRFGAACAGYRLPAAYLTGIPADYLTELQLPVEPASLTDERAVA